VILQVLRRHPALYYSQGYHDIVQVFLLVLGVEAAPAAVTRLSFLRVRDYMLPSLDPAIAHLELLPPIINAVDVELYQHLPKIQPSFALAATLTLFAHVVQEYGDIARLFDFFLAQDTVIPVYLFAVVCYPNTPSNQPKHLAELDRLCSPEKRNCWKSMNQTCSTPCWASSRNPWTSSFSSRRR